MPKEVITHAESYDTRGRGGELADIHTGPSLSVRWENSHQGSAKTSPGDVMVAVSLYPTVTREEFRAAKSWPPSPEREILCGPLDRAQLNKLIRTLRRARDAAFGRDE